MSEREHRQSPRLGGVDLEDVSEKVAAALESQRKKWGAPLANHLIYARCPEIFDGARGMWAGLDRSGLVEGPLAAMVNRRVALLNQCHF
jgi:hypothetical protein